MNQFFPYQQPYYQPRNDIQFVNGLESAQAYQMQPNSKQILMDSNQARFYLVQTDAAGMKSVKSYDFQESEQPKQLSVNDYVTREEFEQLKASINESVTKKRTSKPAKTDDE
jgi:hypothetical protein